MPIIRIAALAPPASVDVTAVLKRLCVEVAQAAGVPSSAVWATFATLAPGHYVEGETAAMGPRADTHPPIVELIAFEGRSDATIAAMLEAAARVLCPAFGLEAGNLFAIFTEGRSGRVYTGGAVRRRL